MQIRILFCMTRMTKKLGFRGFKGGRFGVLSVTINPGLAVAAVGVVTFMRFFGILVWVRFCNV